MNVDTVHAQNRKLSLKRKMILFYEVYYNGAYLEQKVKSKQKKL